LPCFVFSRAKEESKKQQELLQERERERIEHERQQQEAIREVSKKNSSNIVAELYRSLRILIVSHWNDCFQAHRLEVERHLPPEPEEGAGDVITKIRYRLPGGRNIERRFRVTDTLKVSRILERKVRRLLH